MLGFTLFEVLISLLLLTFAFLGVDAVFTTALHQERALQYTRQANLLADNMNHYMAAHQGNHVDYDTIWKQQIETSLPQGRGEVESVRKEIHVSWGGVDLACQQQQFGISGCITMAISPS